MGGRGGIWALDGVHAAYRETEPLGAVEVGWSDVGRVEGQAVSVATIEHARRPVDPARAAVVRISAIPVPSENKVIRILTPIIGGREAPNSTILAI